MDIVVLAGPNREGADVRKACAAQNQHHMSESFEILRSPAAIYQNSAAKDQEQVDKNQETTAHCKPPLCIQTQEWTHSAQSTNAPN